MSPEVQPRPPRLVAKHPPETLDLHEYGKLFSKHALEFGDLQQYDEIDAVLWQGSQTNATQTKMKIYRLQGADENSPAIVTLAFEQKTETGEISTRRFEMTGKRLHEIIETGGGRPVTFPKPFQGILVIGSEQPKVEVARPPETSEPTPEAVQETAGHGLARLLAKFRRD